MRIIQRFAGLFFCWLLWHGTAFAQEHRISGNFQSARFSTLVRQVEQSSPYRFYYEPSLDTFTVNIIANGLTIKELLQQVFQQSPYHFSIGPSNRIYITKQAAVQTNLPPDFFDRTTIKKDTLVQITPVTEPAVKDKIKAPAENKLYEIGTRSAQPKGKVTLAGYVKDVKSGEPIPGASIYVDSLSTGVLTDQFGYYSVTLPAGRHQMQISSVGMKNTKRQVMLHSDGQLNIELAEYVPSLKEVVVTAERTSNTRSLQMGTNRLSIKTIKQVPVVFGEADVLKVVLTLPGVTTVGEASTGFNVRGGSADQNLIILNDLTIYNPSHLFGFFSAFNPDVIKGVELYKSAIPEKYGGRLSSVLDVTTREGNSKKISGSGGIGPLTSKLSVEGPIVKDRTTFIVSGRTSYSNWLLTKVKSSAYKNSRASFYDADLHIAHTINAKNSLYLNGYISSDQFKLNNDTLYQYGNKNINLKWKHIFNNKFFMLATTGFDHYQYKVSSESNPVNAYELKFNINQLNLRTDFSYTLSSKHLLKFGLTSIYYKLDPGTFEPKGSQSLVVPDKLQSEQALESALYLGDEFTITPDLSINAGIRYSVFNYLGPHNQYTYAEGLPRSTNTMTDTVSYQKGKIIQTYSNPEFRFTLRYSLPNNASVKFSFNTLRQYIHMLSNTNAISPTDVWKLSDAHIKPQEGSQISAGFYKNFKSNTIETSVEVYYKQLRNYLDYKSGAALILNHHIETDVITSKGRAYGTEFLLKKNSGKLNGWISYSYSRILLQSDDALAGELVNGGKEYPANYDKPHNANLIANYRFSHRYSISLGVTYSTGRPVTLPLAVFNYGGGQRVYYSDRNMHRIPDYFRADLSFMIEGNHRIKKLTHNSWTFGVYNLTGRKNAYSVYFVQESGQMKGYQLSIFGTIIPFVTYNFRF
ncbi:MAG TPA: TonB-dependent receptor [Chitinophagaceae bacterium]|nr:TonB-dependent receptor [Chitinophagaceae bacterium]